MHKTMAILGILLLGAIGNEVMAVPNAYLSFAEDTDLKKFRIVMSGEPQAVIIVGSKEHTAVRLAAEELVKYLKLVSGATVPIEHKIPNGTKTGVQIIVGPQACRAAGQEKTLAGLSKMGEEAFGVWHDEDRIYLSGVRPRATLYAVYSFLEMIGVRFIEPGDEVVPKKSTIEVSIGERFESPTFSFREYYIGCKNFATNMGSEQKLISWAVKNRLSHITIGLFQGLARNGSSANVIELFPQLAREVKRYDLTLVVGGHGIYCYLVLPKQYMHQLGGPDGKPSNFRECMEAYRKVIKDKPEWFGGEKWKLNRNEVCMSHPEAVEHLARNAVEFLKHHPEVDVLRLACGDSMGRYPCSCEKCQSTRSDESHLRSSLAIARKVYQWNPQKMVAHTFMSGSQWRGEPRQISIKAADFPPNTFFWQTLEGYHYVAPIYAPVNGGHHRNMKYTSHFLKDAGLTFVAKEMHGSGYYAHIYSVAPHIIAKNLRYYQQEFRPHGYSGSNVFTNLHYDPDMEPSFPWCWHLYGLNLYTAYRFLWNPQADLEAFLDDYCQKAYPGAEKQMREVLSIVENYGTQLAADWTIPTRNLQRYSPDSLTSLLKKHKAIEDKFREAVNLADEAAKHTSSAQAQRRLGKDIHYLQFTHGISQIMVNVFEAALKEHEAKTVKDAKAQTRLLRSAYDHLQKAVECGKEVLAHSIGYRKREKWLVDCVTRSAERLFAEMERIEQGAETESKQLQETGPSD